MSLHILRHLPFLSRSSTPTVDPKTCRPLPPGLDAREAKAWTSRLGDAQRLLDTMNREVDLRDVRAAQGQVRSLHAPERAISRATLLPVLLRGQPRGAALPELHANRVAPGVVLMAAPHEKEGMLWAEACVQHRVGHVIDLSTKAESKRLGACMGNPATRLRGELAVAFKASRPSGLRDLQDADMRRVEVSLGRPARGEPEGMRAELDRELAWTSVPVSAQRAIAPRTLLEVCRHIEKHPLPAGESLVFQCGDGGHRGAVFAAAHQLHQRFRLGILDRHSLERAVVETCTSLRLNRDVDLFNEPEHLASLLAFGDALIREGRQPAPQRQEPAPQVSGSDAPALKSILKRAAGARATAAGGRRIRFNDTPEVRFIPPRDL